MGIGPVPAVRRVLDRAGLAIGDIDLVELNEAFASQSLAVIRELGLDEKRVNVNGGAIAIGHPLGMSGARLVVTLLHELRRRDLHRGLATLCIGVGQGQAALFVRGLAPSDGVVTSMFLVTRRRVRQRVEASGGSGRGVAPTSTR
jgi:acetyl-CoA C-acetyltransferase